MSDEVESADDGVSCVPADSVDQPVRKAHQDPVDHQGHEELSDGESSSAESVPMHSAHAYSSTRRTPRRHKRVVRQGTELFDADGVKLEPSDMQSERQRAADDDRRILNELPPHWAVFEERS